MVCENECACVQTCTSYSHTWSYLTTAQVMYRTYTWLFCFCCISWMCNGHIVLLTHPAEVTYGLHHYNSGEELSTCESGVWYRSHQTRHCHFEVEVQNRFLCCAWGEKLHICVFVALPGCNIAFVSVRRFNYLEDRLWQNRLEFIKLN